MARTRKSFFRERKTRTLLHTGMSGGSTDHVFDEEAVALREASRNSIRLRPGAM